MDFDIEGEDFETRGGKVFWGCGSHLGGLRFDFWREISLVGGWLSAGSPAAGVPE